MPFDVVVLGGGLAALSATAACAAAGLDVARVDPAPGLAWSSTYGVWLDELGGLDLDAALGHRWSDVQVKAGRTHELGRGYGLFDNGALAALLRQRAAGAPVIEGRAVGANHDRWQSTVVLHDARLVEALVVVDATGPWPAVVHRADVIDAAKPTATAAARTAYRLVARCGEPPGPPGRCLLMDWSPAGGPGRDGPDDEPSHFSAFDLADGWWLVQEVRLAARPPMGQVRLEARLHQRLAGLGVEVHEVRTLEEAAVPLGLPVPSGRQRAVGFGAAAAMVDPLTGWSGGAILRAAPELASAIVAALERRATPAGVSAAAWGAVWPNERRRARALDQHAMRALLRLDRRHLEAFFHALFELPDGQWFGYLTGQASSRQVAATMREAFGGVSSGLRAKLALASPWLLAGGLR